MNMKSYKTAILGAWSNNCNSIVAISLIYLTREEKCLVQHKFYIHQLVLCIQNKTSQSQTETSLEIYVSYVVIHKYIIILSFY